MWSRHIKREKCSLLVDVRRSKTSLLKLPIKDFKNRGRGGSETRPKRLFQFRMKSAYAWRFLPLSRTRSEEIWRRLENVSI